MSVNEAPTRPLRLARMRRHSGTRDGTPAPAAAVAGTAVATFVDERTLVASASLAFAASSALPSQISSGAQKTVFRRNPTTGVADSLYGIATAYAVPVFCRAPTTAEVRGGGLPPSVVAGTTVVSYTDPVTGQPSLAATGGAKRLTLNAELITPFPGAGNDRTLRMYGFFDIGNIYAEDEKVDRKSVV
mgnify:CR=1 FL=1